jgi:hypothetical protein
MGTSAIPHPPYRLPLLGDLGPIALRRLLGVDIVIVGAADLAAELNDETRFGKNTGLQPSRLRDPTLLPRVLFAKLRNGSRKTEPA